MVTIKQAIDDLNKSELVGENICTTEGELIILLQELQRLRETEEKGLLHEAPLPNGTIIYVWQTDEDDCWIVHNEAYLYGFTEYYYGEFGKDFFVSEEECKKHSPR